MNKYTTLRECLMRDIHDLEDQRDFAMSEMERRGRERDKARNTVLRLRKQRAIARNFGEQMERERNEARELARWFYTRLKQVSLDHPLEGNVGGILARLEEAVLDDPWLEAAK